MQQQTLVLCQQNAVLPKIEKQQYSDANMLDMKNSYSNSKFEPTDCTLNSLWIE